MRLIHYAAAAAALTLAGVAHAQGAPAGPPPVPSTPQPQPPELRGPDDRITDFLRLRDETSKRTPGPTNSKRPVPVSPEDVVAGSEVRDSRGLVIGTIESVSPGFAVVVSPLGKIEVETESFAKNNKGLLINMPKSRFDAMLGGGKPNG